MERLVIIDHETHQLYIEDVSEEEIEKYGGEQEYIEENYFLEGDYSWDYITDIQYFPQGEADPIEIEPSEMC